MATTSESEPLTVLETLNTDLDSFEEILKPLLEKPLNDSLPGLELLQKAKANVLLGYIIHDLVWIFLKTKGIDPATHPVIAELDRIKSYFAKIKAVEEKDKPHNQIDKDAASRFIKHAIASQQSKYEKDVKSSKIETAVATPSSVGTSSRFKFLIENESNRNSTATSSSDNELEVENGSEPSTPAPQSGANQTPDTRKRPALDPFAGYDHLTKSDKKPKKSKKQKT